ncbi:DNA-directed RNA polymerase subunit RPC12/RpoP [Mycolicibacterium sp. BK634]|nr:DNA-directed RNA polymerase subunit RPC12/RpoP [Mycolicibacterium sp. BK634]
MYKCTECGRKIGYFPLKDGKGNDLRGPKCPRTGRYSLPNVK